MGLLQEAVQISLTSNVIDYYEKKGYEIPRYRDIRGRLKVKENTKIIVSIDDLPFGCGVSVLMECDFCHKVFSRIWRDNTFHDGKIICKNCSGILRSGEKAYNWNKNLMEEERKAKRDTKEYNDFINRVKARDQYRCKVCGKKSKDIEVHHLDGYSWCVERRTDDNNGITLCVECHYKFHSIYGRGKNDKAQFEEWIGAPIGKLGKGKLPPARKVICMDDGKIHDSAPATAKYYELDRNSLYPVLNRQQRSVFKLHFLWYNDYKKMNKDKICDYWRWVTGKKQDL